MHATRPSSRACFLLLLALSACAGPSDPPRLAQRGTALRAQIDARWSDAGPPPTEHRLSADAEEKGGPARRAWMESMHRAAPGTDWRELERRNGEAQRDKRNQLASMAAVTTRWTERGSSDQAGNTMSAMRSPDGAKLYVGAALGGVWRGNPDGTGWEPLGDNFYGGASWVAVVPGAPGAPDAILRATDWGLIDRSTDEGATWIKPGGLPECDGIRRLLVTEDGSETIFLVAHVKELVSKQWGVYRSTNGGASFVKVTGMGTFPGDLWATRTGATVLYAAKSGKVQRSLDLGGTWTDAGSMTVAGDAELTGSEAGAPRLWAVLNESGAHKLYRSDDAGASWTFLTTLTDYWDCLGASITNADLFCYGGVELWKTTNGGTSFAKQNGWGDYYGNPAAKLHADMMGVDVYPDGGGERWYVNTHGGTYESTNGLATVSNLSLYGLNVSQYYTTHTSSANPVHVVAGAQDQGYQWTDDLPAADGLLPFDQIISGDYGHATSGDGSHAYVYSVYPGFVLIHKGENSPSLYTEDFPASETYGWLPTITADPDDNRNFFFCASKLYRYVKSGPGVNNWTWSQWSAQDFAIGGGEYLTGLAFAPGNHQRAYAVTSHGRLWFSNDKGLTWTQGGGSAPDEHYFYGNATVASRLDPDVAYVGGSGYSGPAVYRTTDGGLTWGPLGSGIPATLVYSLAEAADGTLFAGTETAAYRLDPGTTTWVDITSNEAPVTIWWSAEFVPAANVIRFGTYGRGIWDYALDDPCGYAAYGTGLGGTNVATLDSASPTTLGTTHIFTVGGAAPSAPAWLVYSPAAASLPFKGGTLLVDPALLLALPFTTGAAGTAAVPLVMPADPALDGLPLHWQVLQNAGGWRLSNGLSGAFCQ